MTKTYRKIIFIGGPPRVGKSTLSRTLSKNLGYSWISTDNLRESVIYSNLAKPDSKIYSVKNAGEWGDRKTYYSNHGVEEMINIQNQESSQVSKLVKSFTKSVFVDSERSFILEGVALFPKYYTESFLKKYDINYYCIGNTNYDSFFKYSWDYRSPGDWLGGVDKDTFKKVIKYCSEFSRVFEKECMKRSTKYFEINSKNFTSDKNRAVKQITTDVASQ